MHNITVIIPTHNRHKYLHRSIEYYKKFDAIIYYCDSSEKGYDLTIPENVRYLHLFGKSFPEKIIVALNLIETEYVALCADDDFIVMEALYTGETILDQNNEYSTALGKYVSFNIPYDGRFYPLYNKLPGDINSLPQNNVQLFFMNYYMIMWAMYRKNILYKAFSILNEIVYKNDNYIEIVIGACACNEGGIKFLDQIWGVREISNSDHWGLRNPKIDQNYVDRNKFEYSKVEKMLDKNTFEGCAAIVMKSYLGFRPGKKRLIYNSIKRNIPKFAKEIIAKVIILIKQEQVDVHKFDETHSIGRINNILQNIFISK